MKRLLYGLMCSTIFISGCFWHSSTERVVEEPSGQSSTTVTTPPPSSTTVTTTSQ